MARLLRPGETDAIYHVTSRGVERRIIFRSNRDKKVFLAYLRRDLKRDGAKLYAYCLMGNHYHLLIHVGEVQLGVTMHRLLTRYAVYFNHMYGRDGHLFQGRYGAELCKNLGYLMNAIAYIHENPLRAHLVDHVSQWEWSSHREWMALKGPLIDFEGIEEASGLTPEELREHYVERIANPEFQLPRSTRTLSELIDDAALATGLEPSKLRSGIKGRQITRAKLLLAEWCRQEGFSDVALARELHCSQASISQLRTKRKL